jgi:selenocysteine-specific elongation factor
MSVSSPETPTINVMVGTAGHIDHGKTELVKLLTGCDTDTLREEKERGMTIDLGFAPCILATGERVGVVDVPGHEKFVRNMVAGATGIDMVLLVIAADDGVMPQTREHLALVELLGVKKGLTAVTKIDRVDAERRAAVLGDVRRFLQGTFLAEAPIVGVSPITGEGYGEFYAALNAVVQEVKRRPTAGIFWMPVERVFSVAGYGTVATGIPVRGTVRVGDTLQVLPQATTARVRSLQVYHVDAREGRAGECVALNLTGVEPGNLGRGRVLATPGFLNTGRFVRATLTVLPGLPTGLRDMTRVHFHVGTAEAAGRVALLEPAPPVSGGTVLAEVRLDEPVVTAAGDRYVVRGLSPLTTLGGGLVLEVAEGKVRRSRADVLTDLHEREKALSNPRSWVAYLVERSGAFGLPREDLSPQSLLTLPELEILLKELVEAGKVRLVAGGRVLISRGGLAAAGELLQDRLHAFHQEHPLEAGASRDWLTKETGLSLDVLGVTVAALAEQGSVAEERGLLRLSDFRVPLSAEQKSLADRLEALFRERLFSTPSLAEAATALGAAEEEVAELGRLLEQQGRLVTLGEKVTLHREALDQARSTLLRHLAEQKEVRAADLRDLLGTSRKYAIALLDYFDRTGLLLRRENVHYLRPGGRKNESGPSGTRRGPNPSGA